MFEKPIHSFLTLFVTANPISIVPLFLVVTAGMISKERNAVAIRSVLIATVILIAFAVAGDRIIAFFGITIEAFEVAGGLLLFATAFHMIFASEDRGQKAAASVTDSDLTTVAVFPLAIPMMAGPGAISATILLTSRRDDWVELVGLIIAIAALMVLTFLVLIASRRIDNLIGSVGRIVVGRLLGVILAALAIQFMGTGVRTFVETFSTGTS
ncbi:MarC family protein [Bauldia sp.]|uniref:MarC family protein n=1 Tax=Bauldia sp. TaxID=2575872 RepID=UPI003BACD76E